MFVPQHACRAALWIGLTAVASLLSGCNLFAQPVSSPEDMQRIERRLPEPEGQTAQGVPAPEELAAAVATRIQLRGVVLDEAGEPIRNALVEAVVFDQVRDPLAYPYLGFRRLGVVNTSRNGHFRFRRLRGAALQLRVWHPDYVGLNRMRRTYVFHPLLADMATASLPEAAAPIMFVMQADSGSDWVQVVDSGALPVRPRMPVAISLADRAAEVARSDAADLHIECSGQPLDAMQLAPWWCEVVAARGGGLLPVKEVDWEVVPEAGSGYQDSLRFSYQPGTPGWRIRDQRELFLRTAAGNYAYLEVKMRPVGEFFVAVTGQINLTGGRRLWR